VDLNCEGVETLGLKLQNSEKVQSCIRSRPFPVPRHFADDSNPTQASFALFYLATDLYIRIWNPETRSPGSHVLPCAFALRPLLRHWAVTQLLV